jgi:hypothetical protein
MKWVTRDYVHLDRMACIWLIKRFVDRQATFSFVPWGQENSRASEDIAFSIPQTELSPHDEGGTTFQKILRVGHGGLRNPKWRVFAPCPRCDQGGIARTGCTLAVKQVMMATLLASTSGLGPLSDSEARLVEFASAHTDQDLAGAHRLAQMAKGAPGRALQLADVRRAGTIVPRVVVAAKMDASNL